MKWYTLKKYYPATGTPKLPSYEKVLV